MRTIAITVDEETLALIDQLYGPSTEFRSRSAIVRAAIRRYASHEKGCGGKPVTVQKLPSARFQHYTQYKSVEIRHRAGDKEIRYSGTKRPVKSTAPLGVCVKITSSLLDAGQRRRRQVPDIIQRHE